MSHGDKVRAVIERETGQKVSNSTPLDDLDLDSLEFIDLLSEVDKETGREIPQSLWGDLKTVGDIVVLSA